MNLSAMEGNEADNVSGEYDNQFKLHASYYDSGGDSSRSPSSSPRRGRRYLSRSMSAEAAPDLDSSLADGGRGHQRGGSIELRDLELGLDGSVARHRRTKTIGHARRPSMNGYQYYQYMKRQHSGRQNQSPRRMSDSGDSSGLDGTFSGTASTADIDLDADLDNSKGDNFSKTRQFLKTVRVRRKSRKNRSHSGRSSSRRRRAERVAGSDDDLEDKDFEESRGISGDAGAVGDEGDEDFEEEVGLPSTRPQMKSLTERRQDLKLAATLDSREALGQSDVVYAEGFSRKVKDFGNYVSESVEQFNFWSQQFKEIEGRFGIATSTYFRFTRWLVKINFLVFFLFLCFLYIPQLSYDSIFKEPFNATANLTGSYEDFMFRCSNSYDGHVKNVTDSSDSIDVFLDLAQGTGFLENTMLFYGYYSNLSFWLEGQEGQEFEVKYNMGLGYLLTVGISFIGIFIMIVKNSSSTIKEAVTDFDNKAFPLYTNAVFSGWDYCIKSDKMAFFKQKIIFNEFKSTLEEVRRKKRKEDRTAQEKVRLYVKRLCINVLVITLLGAAFAAIAFATDFMLKKQQEVLSGFEGLLINYLPSIVIVVLNLIVPEIFMILVEFEDYSHSWTTRITITRAVVLRLASVWVLVVALYNRLQTKQEPYACPEQYIYNATENRCCGNTLWQTDVSLGGDSSGRGTVKCWETYVGQQFYKLCLVDFISITAVVLLIGIPRRFLYSKLKDKVPIVNKIGRSKFDLPIQVLDIVYSQTLCWIGMFFTPLLPAITFVKVFIFFFLKKFELLYVAQAPDLAYGASRSYSFFQSVLLVSFIVIASLLGYMVGNYSPSMSCGPFRLYSHSGHVMFSVVTNEIETWSAVPRRVVKYFGTVAFFLPAFLVLMLAIYYYSAMSSGYRKMEKMLKQELKSESHDKQFLLARVDEIINKGQLK